MARRFWIALSCLAIEVQASELSGRVIDAERSAPLTGALLSLPDVSRSVLADPQGEYRIADLEPGMYRVVARHVGYATQIFQALVPEAGVIEITVALRPESIPLEGIEVHGQVPLRSLDPASSLLFPERGLSAAEVRHHPLLSEPDLLQALGGGEVRVDPEAPTGLSVRGGASDQIAYLLDGIPIRNPQHAGGTFSALNPDVVARIDLRSVAPRAEDPSAASGVVSVETHEPGAEPRVRGAASNTQARIAVDGPLGRVGMLLGARVTFPGLVPRKSAATYLRGEGADWLAKLALPIAGGKLRLLSYGNEDEVSVALSNPEFNGGVQPERNLLAWDGTSHGLIWSRTAGSSLLSLRAWAARSDASAHWTGADSLVQRLVTSSREVGLGGRYETVRGQATTQIGGRLVGERSRYRGVKDGSLPALSFEAESVIASIGLRHQRPIGERLRVDLGLTSSDAHDAFALDPAVTLRYRLDARSSLVGAALRTRQFQQSLRNPESLVSRIFPIELQASTESDRIPDLESDLALLALETRITPRLTASLQLHERVLRGLALVAPNTEGPFAIEAPVSGRARSRGVALESAISGTRLGIAGGYVYQWTRYRHDGGSYVPSHAARHQLTLGGTWFPTPSTSVRLGMEGLFGRRGTDLLGPFEWESCNLLDQGCEFVGSPETRAEPLGASRLPAYLRVDLGLRKHWRIQVGDREVGMSLFGSATNLLGRRNVLLEVIDPATGRRTGIEMRPFSPLVAGLEWRF